MSAALDLSAYSREDIQRAPLVWRDNGANMRVRVRDPKWIQANLKPIRPLPVVDVAEVEKPEEPFSGMDDTNWIDWPAMEDYHAEDRFGDIVRQVVALYPFFEVRDVRGSHRDPKLVACRWHCIYELRRRTALSMPAIGKRMGGKDHTSVFHAVRHWPRKAAKLGIPCKPLGGE